jgi:hypothetical protein
VRDRARRVTIRLLRHRINALPVGMSPKGQYVAIGVGGSFDEAHALILRDIAHSSSIKISAPLPSFALPYSGRVFVTPRARHVAFTAGRHAYVYTHRSNQATVVPTPNGRRNAALAAGLSGPPGRADDQRPAFAYGGSGRGRSRGGGAAAATW